MLRKVAQKVDPQSEETQEIIKTMFKVARGEQKGKKKPIMVGLAAPQIGILKRIILVDVAADGRGKTGDLRVYINPEIIWTSKRKGEWYEGCYSTGLPAGRQGKICGIVSRPVSIIIKAFTMQPRRLPHIEKHSGYAARIFQHEIDHLNGKLFIDHITNPDHLHLVEKNEFAIYRDKEAWRNWPKKGII